MAALRVAALVLALLTAMPAQADPTARWHPLIAEASTRFGIPIAWIERVMRAESGGLTVLGGRPLISRAGAMGLMQIMPATWAELRALLGLGADPQDPHDNILAGTFYLKLMYDRFGYPGLFAAYNAGPRRYAEHIVTGQVLPRETRAYLATVGGFADRAEIGGMARRFNGIFFVHVGASALPLEQAAVASKLFVPLQTGRETEAIEKVN